MIQELIKRAAPGVPMTPEQKFEKATKKLFEKHQIDFTPDSFKSFSENRASGMHKSHPLSTKGVMGMGSSLLSGAGKLFNHPLTQAYFTHEMMNAPKATGLAALSKRGSKETPMVTLKDLLVSKIAKLKAKSKIKAPTGEVIEKDNAPTGEDGTKIASADVKFVGELVAGMNKKAEVPGVTGAGAFLGDIYSKLPKFVGGLGTNMMPLLQAGSLLGTGLAGASFAYDKVNNWNKSRQAYRQMFHDLPQLQEYPRTMVDKYWTVLQDFAPALTTNPLVAGQFIQNMLNQNSQGIDHLTLGQLVGIQAQHGNAVNDSGNIKLLGDMASRAYDTTASPSQMNMLTGNYGNVLSQTGYDGSMPMPQAQANPPQIPVQRQQPNPLAQLLGIG